jgi:putative transposase
MHIMGRGNNKQPIFASDAEKRYFRFLLFKMMPQNGVHIYHYCLMDNHFHLVVRLDRGADLSRFLKQVFLAYYSLYRNNHEYVGHLFQGRFKSLLIDTEGYLVQCGKYVELNPVRAGIVTNPEDYPFSSCRYYAWGIDDPLITPDPSYLSLADSESERQALYRELFIDAKMVNSEKLRNRQFIGSASFIERMEAESGVLNIRAQPGRPRGRPPKNQKRPHFSEDQRIDKSR